MGGGEVGSGGSDIGRVPMSLPMSITKYWGVGGVPSPTGMKYFSTP